jgi:hypothetical protein
MGFLDNTTNNIILDAVLTDTGRQFLAKNDGSFSLYKFALGDDEVNYSLINKFGRTVGIEKIQKNIPIFEAITNQNYALKYKLVSLSNRSLTYLPTLSLSQSTVINLNLAKTGNRLQDLTVKQSAGGSENFIENELQDSFFIVEVNDLFLDLQGARNNLQFIDAQQRATYKFLSTMTNSDKGTGFNFTVAAKPISTQLFSVYGNNNVIKTYVKVTGGLSGAVLEFPVNITLS